MLKTVGCTVATVSSGQEAIQLLDGGARFDLILMDCRMPGMSGSETSRQIIQAWPEFEGKIVAMSAHTTPSNREELRDAGMTDMLDKPFRLAELEALLSRV